MDWIEVVLPYCGSITASKIHGTCKTIQNLECFKLYWSQKFQKYNINGKKLNHKAVECVNWHRNVLYPELATLNVKQVLEIYKNSSHPLYHRVKHLSENLYCTNKHHYHYETLSKNVNYKAEYIKSKMLCLVNRLSEKNLSNRVQYAVNGINVSNQLITQFQAYIDNYYNIIERKKLEINQYEDNVVKFKKQLEKLNSLKEMLTQQYEQEGRCTYISNKGKNKNYMCGQKTKNKFCYRHKKCMS